MISRFELEERFATDCRCPMCNAEIFKIYVTDTDERGCSNCIEAQDIYEGEDFCCDNCGSTDALVRYIDIKSGEVVGCDDCMREVECEEYYDLEKYIEYGDYRH